MFKQIVTGHPTVTLLGDMWYAVEGSYGWTVNMNGLIISSLYFNIYRAFSFMLSKRLYS